MSLVYVSEKFNREQRDIDFTKEKIVSYSQYSKYKKCPKSWELRYVRKEKISSPSIYFVYGTAMHEVIQEFLHTAYTQSVKAAEALDLQGMLLTKIKSEYTTAMEEHGEHFSTREELSEFYSDGCEILKFLKKKRRLYFSSRDMELIGVELPLQVAPDPNRPNVVMQQYLDLVFKEKSTGKYKIVDIKTAKNGWNKWKRKDKTTTNQLVFYKSQFCREYNIPEDMVDIEYFILRQKIDPDSMWPIPRISQFSPSDGKVSQNRATQDFQKFLDECFDSNGEYIDKSHPPFMGRGGFNCMYCEYNEREDLCPKSKRIPDA